MSVKLAGGDPGLPVSARATIMPAASEEGRWRHGPAACVRRLAMTSTLDAALRLADDAEARSRTAALLVDLIGVDTTVGPDMDRVRAREAQVFDRIAEAIGQIRGSADGLERVPVDPRIETDAYFTPTHYTKTPDRPTGLDAATTYRGRANLVLRVPGQGRGVLAFNAHVDVVAPYIAPRAEGDAVFGRGACDDKGQVAAMLLALDLIEEARRRGIEPAADLLFEFVVDEESGGNGSLSLALDRRFACDAMVVMEPTDLAVHPANRGAVWYRLDVDASASPRVIVENLAARLVLSLEDEGAAIRAESDHPLFPHRPVQTCHGVLGPFGDHPSTVNDYVWIQGAMAPDDIGYVTSQLAGTCDAYDDAFEACLPDRMRAIVDDAIAAYCRVYGDKTAEVDPGTGCPKVDRHCDLVVTSGLVQLSVYGKSGHMGAAAQCDNAIIKAAYIIKAMEEADDFKQVFVSIGWQPTTVDCRPPKINLEGGQGFLPTHSLEEITRRMREAVARATEAYCRRLGVAYDPALARMTFDKLHNDAYACDPDSPAVRAFVGAARACGIAAAEPLRGWDVSCDARIFAREYPDAAVITFGAGRLEHAHSAEEQVRLDDIATAAKTIARFALTWAPEAGRSGGRC